MNQPLNVSYQGYEITTDKELMDVKAIHKWLSEESYWVKGITYSKVEQGFNNSFCIGVIKDGEQVGYGRLITDYATIAYLADVYITAEHRGKGLSKKMMDILMNLDWVQQLRLVLLGTLDAHSLYTRYDFAPLDEPSRWMVLNRPDTIRNN